MRAQLILCATLLALAAPISVPGEKPFNFETTPGKLPKDVVPKSYDIRVKPMIEQRTFTGSETVLVEVREPVKTITLNANALTIPSAKLVSTEGKVEEVAQVSLDEKEQTATLTFAHEVSAGTHQLALDFAGKINEAGQGLYYASYEEEGSGAKKTMLGTQMEATDARRMFPCWDEPAFRARFRLTATVPANFTAVSNMPIEHEQKNGDEKVVRFAETPPMPSYLVVFCAGELEAIHGEADGVKIGVFTTKGKAETGRYALESAQKILHYYNEYFGVKFPLPKLDLIAVPGGFSGAMENWGGIVFFESTLLFDPAKNSEATRERIFEIEAHEIAHQWFGDLVTMAWWDNLWLNEGFASWMGTKCTDHFNPQWEVWLRADQEKQYAMTTDALSATRPIQRPVENESEANSAFYEITYQKGQAFLRMLESYLEEETFRDGIRGYMQAHQFSNATTADLWNALAAASKKPVSSVAARWTEQPGLPLVSLQSGAAGLTIAQERFTVHQKNPTPLTWKIPIAYRAGDATPEVVLLEAKSAPLPKVDPAQTVALNAGGVGYYRARYGAAHFAKLLAVAAQLPEAEKVNLLSDRWALVKADRGSVEDYFKLIEAVRADDNLAIWEQITGALTEIDALYRGSDERGAYRAYARSILNPVFQRVGWELRPNEKATTGLLRVTLLGALGGLADPEVVAGARARFQKFLSEPESLAPALRPSVCRTVARSADRKVWNDLHELARTTKNFTEKVNYYSALCFASDFAAETLALSLSDELPVPGTAPVIATVSRQGERPELAWQFVQDHRAALDARLGSLGDSNFLPAVADGFNEAARAAELETYARKTLPAGALSQVAKVAEQIRFRADFKKRLLPGISAWLKHEKLAPTPSA